MNKQNSGPVDRRKFLKVTGTGVAAGFLAGCSGGDGGSDGGDGGGGSDGGSDGSSGDGGSDGGSDGDSGTTTGSSGGGDGDPITISAIEPLSGVFAMYGPRHLKGAQYAVQQWNSDGGVLGRNLRIVQADAGAGAQEARSAFTRHVEEEDAIAGIGPGSSEVGIQTSRYAEEAEVPMLVHAAGAASVLTGGKDGRYTFRTALPAVPTVARAQAQIVEQNDYTNIAVIYEDGAWGREFKAGVEAYFPDDVNITSFTAPIPQTDFTSQLRQFPDDVEMVMGSAHPAGVSSMYPQMIDLGIEPDIYPAAITATEVDYGAIGDPIAGPFASFNAPDIYSDKFQEVATQFYEDTDSFFDMNQANGYVAVDLIARAIETAGEASGPAISEALRSESHDTLYAQPVEYTDWGEVKNSVQIYNGFVPGESLDWYPPSPYSLEEVFRSDPLPAFEPGSLDL